MSDDDLFSGAQSAKREGMARAAANADEEWMRLMYSLVLKTAREKLVFTGDDIFRLYYALNERPETRDYRALGPIMALAVKNNVCRKTDKIATTRRRSRHAGLLTVWKSLLFGRPDYLSSPMPESSAPDPTRTNARYDARGMFIIDKCAVEDCEADASFGIGYFPRKNQLGLWYCRKHWEERKT
jgi:hypothetical protein